MNMRSFTLFLVASLLASCAPRSAPAPSAAEPTSSRLRLAAANYPLAYFAQRIGSTEVEVIYPVPSDVDPAFWQPKDDDVAKFQKADLILMNGATYSKWAEKVTLPEDKIVDTSAGFKDRFIIVKSAVTHSHGKQGEHSHDGTAFTTWIDFEQAIAQAEAICASLQKLKPESIEMFALNFDLLKRELLGLDTRMMAIGKKLAERPLVASHPIYQYWARRYQINLQAVLWEPEEVPTEAQMEELKAILSRHAAKLMIWEGEPAAESVSKLKQLGVEGTVFDPCANTPEKGDWLSVMEANLKALEAFIR
jgi:zinc transport system substrate-binding protein